MNLLQLTIETFDKNVETDFTSFKNHINYIEDHNTCLLYTSPSPRDTR